MMVLLQHNYQVKIELYIYYNTTLSKNIEIHRSDECNNIIFNSTGNGVTTECSLGSFKAGDLESTSSNNITNNNTTNNSTVSNDTTIGGTTTYEPAPAGRTVYWVSGGKSYHYTQNCSILSRSKNIIEGGRVNTRIYYLCRGNINKKL